jgi:hypothetical protein
MLPGLTSGRPASLVIGQREFPMELDHITFVGPPIDDREILAKLPDDLTGLLEQLNGFIQFHGGLHVRGACREPAWHALRDAWVGERAFHSLYPAVRVGDIPFAEDCMGDQFMLRDRRVVRLAAETGEVQPLELGLAEFFSSVQADPIEFLSLHPLLQFQREGRVLAPGQLLGAYPPFCITPPDGGVHLAPISVDEGRRFLAYFAAQIRDAWDGDEIVFTTVVE